MLLEQASQYLPEKHFLFPRAIELKPERFAFTAILLDQVARQLLRGEGDEIRFPALQAMRNRQSGLYDADSLLKLREDWCLMDCQAAITTALTDPANRTHLEEYECIVEDIITDPAAEEPYTQDTAFEELLLRLDPSCSLETETGVYQMIRWSQELRPHDNSENRRSFLIREASFLEQLAELEITHLEQYFHRDWLYNDTDSKEAGVGIRREADGQEHFYLANRRKRPPITFGRPIGCPAGFDLAGDLPDRPTNDYTTVTRRFITAYINEAYDRELL